MAVDLRVMSYNIRYDNPNDGENVWRERRDKIANAIRFHKPGVVGLQEALHAQLQDLSERLPGYEWLPAGRKEVENAGEYAAIGYDRDRFNLEREGIFWLSETPDEPGSVGWDANLPRLAHYVELREQFTDVTFWHFNTHFDHAGEESRLNAAKLLLHRIDGLVPDDPVVITGDFNCRAGSPPYVRLTGRTQSSRGRTLRDSHRYSKYGHHGPETSMTDFSNLIPDKKIDHVFVSSDVEVVLHGILSDAYASGRYASDHLPVVADVSLPELNDTSR
ncbi:endonuclease/exonuclease/phosphatase family protein [Halomicrococcus gelatinilyticus]|uniref:endonuclease/exonuclease/phosphatase family protein n=1 Tax=Halomicrococcus gelatinilyticus TaxID=1702103 RepID=UPI002E14DB59